MAADDATPTTMSKLAAEFLGTFLLVFTVGCNVLTGQAVWGGVSIACVLMVAIYALGGISGANFNPAVSLTLGISKSLGGPGMGWADVAMYMLVQVLGGCAAAGCYFGLFMESFALHPVKPYGWWEAGLCEIFFTFMLCFVVMNVAVAKKNAEEAHNYYGLAIGFVIVAGAYGAGAISMGCFNPAVAIGIDAASLGKGGFWSLGYTAFEFLGAALAVVFFKVVRPEDFESEEQAEERRSLQENGEAAPAAHAMPAKLVSEFLGTFMLVLTVGLNVLAGSKAGAYSIAASLMCMIYALGDVSGAHFNPAVTTAILCTGAETGGTAIAYMITQILAGIVAAFTYAMIHSNREDGNTFPLGPKGDHGWGEVVIGEFVFTFVLAYVVLGVAVSPTTKSKQMFGLAIGACVTVGGNAIGGVSGGSLNPAVSFGIAAAHITGGGFFWKSLVYTAAEILGGVTAAGVHKLTHAVDFASKKKLDEETA